MTSLPAGSRSPQDERTLESMLGVPHREQDNASISQLVGGIIADAQELIRREIDLAKQEVSIEMAKVKNGAVMLGAGAVLALVGSILLADMFALLITAVTGLALWISYLIVGVVVAAIGGVLLWIGIQRMRTVDPMPRETIATVKEDVEWIREQNPSDKISNHSEVR